MAVKTLHHRKYMLLLLIGLAYFPVVNTFWLGNRSAVLQRRRISSYTKVYVLSAQENASPSRHEADHFAEKDKGSKKSCLVLRADYVKETAPAPATSQKQMVDFFRKPLHRDCLISAGGKRETRTIATTDELLEKWKKRALSLRVSEPERCDAIIEVRVGGIQFPGISLESISLIGSKLLIPIQPNMFPSYEFVLIQDKRQATGLRPFVWVYEKLTGEENKNREHDTAPTSLSRVTVQQIKGDEGVTFRIETFLEIRINFPAFLLKILPVTKKKAEAQGSQGIAKVIESDIDIAMAKFRDMYIASL